MVIIEPEIHNLLLTPRHLKYPAHLQLPHLHGDMEGFLETEQRREIHRTPRFFGCASFLDALDNYGIQLSLLRHQLALQLWARRIEEGANVRNDINLTTKAARETTRAIRWSYGTAKPLLGLITFFFSQKRWPSARSHHPRRGRKKHDRAGSFWHPGRSRKRLPSKTTICYQQEARYNPLPLLVNKYKYRSSDWQVLA